MILTDSLGVIILPTTPVNIPPRSNSGEDPDVILRYKFSSSAPSAQIDAMYDSGELPTPTGDPVEPSSTEKFLRLTNRGRNRRSSNFSNVPIFNIRDLISEAECTDNLLPLVSPRFLKKDDSSSSIASMQKFLSRSNDSDLSPKISRGRHRTKDPQKPSPKTPRTELANSVVSAANVVSLIPPSGATPDTNTNNNH